MKILQGPRTVRRYYVPGLPDVPDNKDLLTTIQEHFQHNAFNNPVDNQKADEQIGWVTVDSILDADFSLFTKWHTDSYIYAQMRIDKKNLPSNLFKATLAYRIQEWLDTNRQESIPKREKFDIKEKLTFEMLQQTLPRVKVVEFCWNMDKDYLLVFNLSESVNLKFAELFYKTFGLELEEVTPFMFLDAEDPCISALEKCTVSSFRGYRDQLTDNSEDESNG